jgi:hypothetical protein
MSRRIDIELTSALADGSWTWRAAGARHPKGVVPGSVLPADVKVGDELKVEVEQEIDGITVLGVVQGRPKAERSDLIELLPSERGFQPVVETRAPGGGRRRDDDRPRRPRRDDAGGRGDRRPRADGERGAGRDGGRGDGRGDAARGPAREGGRGDGERRPRREGADRPRRGPSFTPPPEVPQRPKPQRLKPGKAHRNAVLGDLPEEQRPIAELALQGLAAVRQKVRDENQKATAEGRATMPEATVMKIAEELLPKLRVAEWRDRAEAAQKQIATLDLRDLRSVVAAANDPIVVRDETTRSLATELTEGLATKQEQELLLWFGDVDAALAVGRVVRALRLSSQPPKAGVPFPTDIAQRLADSANAALAPMDPPERWIAMLEAAAFSPVRAQIKPLRKPDVVNDELTATVTRLAPALPQVAELFGIEVDPKASMPKPLRPGPRPGGKDAKSDRGDKPRGDRKPKGEASRDKAAKPAPGAPTPSATAATTTEAGETTRASVAPEAGEPDGAVEAPSAEAPDVAEAPAAEEQPEDAAAPELAETAHVEDQPATDAAPQATETPATEEQPAADTAPQATETAHVEDQPATDATPEVAETPATEEQPAADAAPQATEPSDVVETPAAEEQPAADAPQATETADVADTPVADADQPATETPDVTDTETANTRPEAADTVATEAAPQATETPAVRAAESADVDDALADLLDDAAGNQLIAEAKAVRPESSAVEAEADAIASLEQAADELDS